MPLWQIYHPAGTFEDNSTRQALSNDITQIYTRIGLPPFYVVVQFILQPAHQTYVGGQAASTNARPFIRIVVDQIAVRLNENDDARFQSNRIHIDRALKPHIADKGYDWEYHVDQTERRLWKINGLIPPPWQSEDEKIWARENKPSSWAGALDEPSSSL